MGVSRGVQPLVLIVDDDGPILDSLGEILAEEGYAVAMARNGQEALAYLAANPSPDCILLDVMMPVMNGYEFRRAQLRDPRLAAIPTLLLTAGHVDGRVADLRLSGWLRKPINLPLLLASVQQHARQADDDLVAPFAGHMVHFYLQEVRMLDRAAAHLAEGLESRRPGAGGVYRTSLGRAAGSAGRARAGRGCSGRGGPVAVTGTPVRSLDLLGRASRRGWTSSACGSSRAGRWTGWCRAGDPSGPSANW